MIRIYQTSKTRFVLSEKKFDSSVSFIGTAKNVGEAFDTIMDEHYIPSEGVIVRFDRDLKDDVLESSIPDVFENDFISVKRYLPKDTAELKG